MVMPTTDGRAGESYMDEAEGLRREVEKMMGERADIERSVRTYETAEDPVPWADRPDVFWCIACDQYHRTDYEHEVTA